MALPKYLAPLPWSVDRETPGKDWTDSCRIVDADGGIVCVLTRGYQPEQDCMMCGGPSWDNADFIISAVNAYGGNAPR